MKYPVRTMVLMTSLTMLSAVATVSMTGCATDREHRSTGAYLDDKAITAKVKTELLADGAVKGMDISVETFRGHVQLNGFVDNQQQKQRAEQIARNTEGVVAVQNNLELKPEAAGAEAPLEQQPQQQ